jgi:hypothetical protein
LPRQLGLRAGDGVAGVLQLFAANEVRGAQRDAAVQVSLRLGEGGLFDVDIRLQLLAVDHLLTGLTHAGGQLRLGFLKRLLGIGLIEVTSGSPFCT